MGRREKALALLHDGTCIPAIPLALDAGRHFDEARQRVLLRYYLAAGAGGIAVAVHTTQFAIRRPDVNLLEPVLRAAAEEIDAYETRTGRAVVRVAGACGPTEQAQAEARLEAELGYDAVLLSPGGLDALSESEMVGRTRRVADVLPVIGFCLQRAVGGRRFSYDYWRAVADTDNVAALKCAPFDRYQTLDMARACAFSVRADKASLYTGNDDNLLIDLLTRYSFSKEGKEVSVRFAGGLLGHWSVWTHTAAQLFRRVRALREADSVPASLLTLAAQITDSNAAVFDAAHNFAGCIPGVHEVLRRQGLLAGTWCLDPAETLSPGQAQEIDRVCRMYPHLTDDDFVQEHLAAWQAGNV